MWRLFFLCLTLGLALPLQAQEGVCRQKLALALDVSGSVDAKEYRLQLEGLVEALTDPEVRAILVAPGAAPVAIHVFEWSGPEFQRVLVDWTLIEDVATLEAVARRLLAVERVAAPPSTALGTAMVTGARILARGPDCWKATLDISGDGKSNTGPRPKDLPDVAGLSDLTINALVIETIDSMGAGPGDIDLMAYFQIQVIRGPDAFAMKAKGFEDYAKAMKRKLLKELEALSVGLLDTSQ